ncbi:hypothetical protein C9374_010542 [Naegleria lovaniensis]|uniref:Fungal lipase-type domain-containing protein n=1 Tax=Naegleria lovaniensis TaxID=51637 RepID=A0AA88GGL1_NAELO|nr:uncharacterized protein C9374_010542 [Naegleria lovaniensis]KAG2374798.1 hypothetical protein C9374_010542 [Naegleria lovaniensis]
MFRIVLKAVINALALVVSPCWSLLTIVTRWTSAVKQELFTRRRLKFSALGVISQEFNKTGELDDLIGQDEKKERLTPSEVLTNASVLISLARLSYEPNETIQNVLQRSWGIPINTDPDHPNYYFISVIDTQAFIIETLHHIIVVFRGTEPFNLRDWGTDRLFRMRPLAPTSSSNYLNLDHLKVAMAHSGFLDALEVFDFKQSSKCCLIEIYAHLCKVLQKRTENKSIFICGHSLGGGLASVFSFMLEMISEQLQQQQQQLHPSSMNFIDVRKHLAGVYTFGAPRVFNDEACRQHASKIIGKRTFRFVHDHDVVPQLPNYDPNNPDTFETPQNCVTKTLRIFLNFMTDGSCPRPYFHIGKAFQFKKLSSHEDDDRKLYSLKVMNALVPQEGSSMHMAVNQAPPMETLLEVEVREPPKPWIKRVLDFIGKVSVPYIMDHHPDGYENCCIAFRNALLKQEENMVVGNE